MLEEIESILRGKLISKAEAFAWNLIQEAGKSLWNRAIFESSLKNYALGYLTRHGRTNSLGLQQPMSIYQLFASVHVIPPDFLISFRDQRELERSLASSGSFAALFPGRMSWLDVANANSHLNILGAPGSGKTTLLKRLGLEALLSDDRIERTCEKGSYNYSLLPVYIELKSLQSKKLNLVTTIVREFEVCKLPYAQEFVENALSNGKLLILLDGLDEVNQEGLKLIVNHLQNFVDQYSKNRFVVSSRTAFYRSYLRQFKNVVMADFDDSQIRRVAKNWFSSREAQEEKTAEKFCQALFSRENRMTLELARTPLLLTYLCMVYARSLRFPVNRANLYHKALEILLEEWAAEKLVHYGSIYDGFTNEMEMELLGQISFEGLIEDRYFFDQHELTGKISRYFEDELKAPRVGSKDILNAIQVQQGILVKRAEGVYSFCHQTIQEYLTAHWICGNPSRMKCSINNHALVPRWREVFLLSAGLGTRQEVSELLREIATEGRKIIDENEKLKGLFECICTIVDSSIDEPTVLVAKRFLALGFTSMLDLGFAISTAMANDLKTAIDRVKGLKRARRLCLLIATKLSNSLGESLAKQLDSLTLARDIDADLDRTIHYALDEERNLDAELLLIIVECGSAIGVFSMNDYMNVKKRLEDSDWSDDGSSFRDGLNSIDSRLEMSDFQSKDREDLNKFLYLVQLLVEARDLAATLSKTAWNDIANSVLTPLNLH